MAPFATVLFVASLGGIAALFGIKYREEHAGESILPGFVRRSGDEHALALKELLARIRAEAATWPPRFLMWLRRIARILALSVAALARLVERNAYRLADRFSHKHYFERREPQSDFLKKVGDFKNGGDATPLE